MFKMLFRLPFRFLSPLLHFKTLHVFLSGDGWGVRSPSELFDVLLLSIFIVFPINNVIVQMQLLTHICFLKLFVFAAADKSLLSVVSLQRRSIWAKSKQPSWKELEKCTSGSFRFLSVIRGCESERNVSMPREFTSYFLIHILINKWKPKQSVIQERKDPFLKPLHIFTGRNLKM